MKELNIYKKLKNSSLIFVTIAVFSYSFYPSAMLSIVLGLFLGLTIICNLQNFNYKNITEKRALFFLSTSWVFCICISIIYSENKSYGLVIGQRYFNIIIIITTFLFFFPKEFLKYKSYIYLSFVISNVLFALYIYYKAILVIEQTCFPEIYYSGLSEKLSFVFNKPNHIILSCFEIEYHHSFLLHKVYNGMHYLFAILLSIEMLFEKKNILRYLLLTPTILLFICLILYQFSVLNLFLLIVLVPSFVFIKLKASLKFVFRAISIWVFFGIIITQLYPGISQNKIATSQIEPALNLVKKTLFGSQNKNVDERFEINQANLHLIKEKPLFGYGIGDVQIELNRYYSSKIKTSGTFKTILNKELNSHNNYAFLWLSGGILCVILFFLGFGYFFYLSIRNQNWLFFFFLIIIFVNMLTENILSRINGILFFSLFTGLFLISSQQSQPS